jgi:cell division cycle 14
MSDVPLQPVQVVDQIWIWPAFFEDQKYGVRKNACYFRIDRDLCYSAFCDDFGPMNLGAVYRFCTIVESQLEANANRDIILVSAPDKRSVTNAVFLLGAFMIMKLEYSPKSVSERLDGLKSWLLSFRDVSPGPQNFHLHLLDCWEGLWMAKQLSWVSFAPGGFELSDYEHCDNPLNADLHEVVPNKFVAMRGPKAIGGGRAFEDTPAGARDFSPAYYADILRQFDVRAVVRLNEACYDAGEWEQEGLAVADLPFDDCGPPPAAVVAKFLAIAEGVPGALAVHCKAGLGRTGTLIALYMMKHHGFTARQAMGWLRIVRPGSVIGPQQQYLCASESVIRAAGEAFRRRGGPAVRVAADAAVADVSAFIAAAAAAANARAAALVGGMGVDVCGGAGAEAERAGLAEHVAAAAEGRSVRRTQSLGVM